jgi:hypothetical protein
MPGSSTNSCVNQAARFKNDLWTCDFIIDRTADGGSLKWLSLVDEYTRECLALNVGASMTSGRALATKRRCAKRGVLCRNLAPPSGTLLTPWGTVFVSMGRCANGYRFFGTGGVWRKGASSPFR